MKRRKKARRDAGLEAERHLSDDAYEFDMDSDATWEDDVLRRFESERWNPQPKRSRRKWREPKGNRDDEFFEDTYFERGA